MSGGVLAKLLEARHARDGRIGREELPHQDLHALNHISSRGGGGSAHVPPTEKLYAWNMLTPLLARIGVRITGDDRTLITAGDEDVALGVLTELRARLAPGNPPRAEAQARASADRAAPQQQHQKQQQQHQQQQPYVQAPAQARQPSYADSPARRATPPSRSAEERRGEREQAPSRLQREARGPPPEWRGYLARILKDQSGLTQEQADRATGGGGCEGLRAMLMSAPGAIPWGAGGALSFLKTVVAGAGELVAAGGREVDAAHTAVHWGMYAPAREIVLWSFRAAANVAAERRVTDGGGSARTSAWLSGRGEGAGSVTPLDGVVAGVRRHGDTAAAAIAVLENAAEERLGALLSADLLAAAKTTGGQGAGVEVVARIVSGLRNAPNARAALLLQKGLGPLLRRAVEEARAVGVSDRGSAEVLSKLP